MGVRGGFCSGLVALLLLGATPARAQFSDGYNFIKAVRDRDGDKAMTYLNKPGQPVLNVHDANGDTALHIVVRRHDEQWLAFLLGRGADTAARDRDGNTPLIVAAQLSDTGAAQVLLAVGAKVDAANAHGETALIISVQQRDLATIRLLLANGADTKISDTIAGKTARDYATEDSRSAAIVRLIDEAKPRAPAPKLSGPVLH